MRRSKMRVSKILQLLLKIEAKKVNQLLLTRQQHTTSTDYTAALCFPQQLPFDQSIINGENKAKEKQQHYNIF